MNHVCIDIGSKTIKLLYTVREKKAIRFLAKTILHVPEIPLAEEESEEKPVQQDHYRNIFKLINEDLNSKSFDGKISVRFPEKFFTNRVVNVPVVNRKKAEQLLPFQLEEMLPFPSGQTHFSASFKKIAKKTEILVTVVRKSDFDDIFQTMTESGFRPSVLASFSNYLQHLVEWSFKQDSLQKQKPLLKKNCMVIDMGQSSTKAYFLIDGRVQSQTLTFFGLNNYVEAISKLYSLNEVEAQDYIFKKAFFLTPEQYQSVTPDQAKFAKLMEDTSEELVREILRWTMTNKIKFTEVFDCIYLIGGGARIKNIENFLSLKVHIPCLKFDLGSVIKDHKGTIEPEWYPSWIMAISSLNSAPLPNLLRGAYSLGNIKGIPLHSVSFNGIRVLVIALIISFFLVLEKAFLIRDQRMLKAQLNAQIKSPKLEFNRNDQRRYSNNSPALTKVLDKKLKEVRQEVTTLQAASKENALAPLITLSQIISSNKNIELLSIKTDMDLTTALFKGTSRDEIKLLQDRLQASSIPITKADLLENGTKLFIELIGDL